MALFELTDSSSPRFPRMLKTGAPFVSKFGINTSRSVSSGDTEQGHVLLRASLVTLVSRGTILANSTLTVLIKSTLCLWLFDLWIP